MRSIIPKVASTILTLCLSALTFTVTAQVGQRQAIEVSALGPQVGDQVPDFRLPDQYGNYHTLEDVMGPNGAMLLFHRSADW